MKKIVIFLFVLSQLISCGQAREFDINKKTLSNYFENETKYKGGKILDESIKTIKEELSLVSYIRSDNNIPDTDLIVRYVFFKKDSIIKEIRYEWDTSNNYILLGKIQNETFREKLVKFFKELEKVNVSKYGKGNTEGYIPSKIDEEKTYEKKIKWILNKTEIELSIFMSNNLDKIKNTIPVHRIYLSFKSINLKGKPEYKKTELLQRKYKN